MLVFCCFLLYISAGFAFSAACSVDPLNGKNNNDGSFEQAVSSGNQAGIMLQGKR